MPSISATNLHAGFDPDSSTNVVLENSVIQAGDDCVAIYSVRGPTNNVVVRNVTCHTPLSITHGNYGKRIITLVDTPPDSICRKVPCCKGLRNGMLLTLGLLISCMPVNLLVLGTSNVTFQDCTVRGDWGGDHTYKPRWWKTALRLKSDRHTNGTLQNIRYQNIRTCVLYTCLGGIA